MLSKEDEKPSKPSSPTLNKDGILYVEEGQSYDEDEYETDSDNSYDSSYSDSNGSNHGMLSSEESIHDEEGDRQFESAKETEETENGEDNFGYDVEHSSSKQNLQVTVRDNAMNNMENRIVQETKNPLNENKTAISETNALEKSNVLQSEVVNEAENTEVTEPTISENRSLIALAAEHDRVDVIKNVLQPFHPNKAVECDSSALIQLMLNNRINDYDEDSKRMYTEDDVENIFLPPLHLAIASSSTNAACCFLRMGADPSIRPFIPVDWSPNYKTVENMEPGIVVKDWSMFNGLSAWELAFGTCHTMDGAKEGWFQRSSKNGTSYGEKKSPLNISPSKLEGIRNAFMAEALRAIGSDEVNRLSELIKSGIDNTSRESSYHNERIEVGGKDLLGWCTTMNAVKCSNMLQTVYSNFSNGQVNTNGVVQADGDIENTKTVAPVQNADEDKSSQLPTDTSLCDLQAQLEENGSLAMALSNILDDLAEEVSDLQGLMFENGQPSNSALLSQIRSLKEARGQKDDELVALENRVGDLETELRMVLMWWRNRGGSDDDILSIDLDNLAGTQRNPPATLSRNEISEVEGKKDIVKELLSQIALSENNIRKMRTKISDLAEEKSHGMTMVEKMGLAGAVKLSRTLKEEILEKEYALENAKRLETEYYARIKLTRDHLENKTHEACSTRERTAMETAVTAEMTSDGDKRLQDATENVQLASVNELTQTADVQYDEGMELIEVELSNNYADDSNDSDKRNEDIAPSEAIARGESSAITTRVEDFRSHLSINIWNLILRIVSLGRVSFQQAVSTTAKEGYSNVMIV